MGLIRLGTSLRYDRHPQWHPRPGPRGIHASSSRRGTQAEGDVAQSMRDMVASERGAKGYQAKEEGLRMLVFGKPGSGKGTLSSRLVKMYDLAFVSTGDVLRKEIAAKSEVGRKAEEVVRTGGLVSDELMLEIVKAELDRLRGKSWIIDGFPRTLHQGQLLDEVLAEEGRPLNMIVHLNVPDSVIMARIAARWVHLPSGRVYNTTYSAPRVEGIDDITGEPLTKRADDTPEVFSKRLKAYYDSTAPLLEFFSSSYPENLRTLSGSTSDEVLSASGFYSVPPPPVTYASERDDVLFASLSGRPSHSLSHAEYVSSPITGENSNDPGLGPRAFARSRPGSSPSPSPTDSNSKTHATSPPPTPSPGLAKRSESDASSSSSSSPSSAANDHDLELNIDASLSPASPKSRSTTLLTGPTAPHSPDYDPLIHYSPAVNATLDQLWPQLQALVEPFGLRRRDHVLGGQEAEEVRKRADDLRDPEEDTKVGDGRK